MVTQCQDCRFWLDALGGRCLRYPPRYYEAGEAAKKWPVPASMYPPAPADTPACGEAKPAR